MSGPAAELVRTSSGRSRLGVLQAGNKIMGASQMEGFILGRLHILAATSSSATEGCLNLKDPWKAAFVSCP